MPVVSTYFGIVVRMFFQEHGVPHFHAEHRGEHASFTFAGELLAGRFRSRAARRLVREWSLARSHQLEANWSKARRGEPLDWIAPLD